MAEKKRIRKVEELKNGDQKKIAIFFEVRKELSAQLKTTEELIKECNGSIMEVIKKYDVDSIISPIGTATIATRGYTVYHIDKMVDMLKSFGVSDRRIAIAVNVLKEDKDSAPFINFRAKNGGE